jgi:hypothetical protein
VATCGYGELWANADPNRQYTASFGGTSAAAPMIAGCVARLQGLCRQLYGISLTPEEIRDGITGFEQCQLLTGQCGPDMLGNDDVMGDACSGDVWAQDPVNPGDPMGVPNYIGPFPGLSGWFSNLAQTGVFDGSPLLQQVYVIGGHLLYGNDNSVRAVDGNYLVVESVNISQGDSPSGDGSDPELPEADQAYYLGNGAITDVVAVYQADIEDVEAMATTYCLQQPTTFQILFVESWDYKFHRWEFIDLAILPVEVPCLVSQPPKAAEYVNDDGRILIRYWTFGFLGQTGFGVNYYRTRWDLLDLDVSAVFGEQLP